MTLGCVPTGLRRGGHCHQPTRATGPSAGPAAHVLLLLVVVCAAVAPAAAAAPPGTGSVQFAAGFSLEWALQADQSTMQFNLTWPAQDKVCNWGAFGLHAAGLADAGMPQAEVFMCDPTTPVQKQFCQVRNTAAGYTTPALNPPAAQYLQLVSASLVNGVASAVFRRPIHSPVKNGSGVLTFDLVDAEINAIFACGPWQNGSMPDGGPLPHGTVRGVYPVNFLAGVAPSPPPPSPPSPPSPPPPPPSPPAPQAGVWPQRFDSHLTVAPTQEPNPTLTVSLSSRIRYSFPDLAQLWQYYDLQTGALVGTELWVKKKLYEIDPSSSPPKCSVLPMEIDILRPDWLRSTTYAGTFYLLRQAPHQAYSNYTRADLWQLPGVIGGMTNSWMVANSSIAEPIRLAGPDDFAHPELLSILEFDKFEPVQSFPPGLFDVPSYCANATAPAPGRKWPPVPMGRH